MMTDQMMTVEECAYWLMVVEAESEGMLDDTTPLATYVVKRDCRSLYIQYSLLMEAVRSARLRREWAREGWLAKKERELFTTMALHRMAIKTIRQERMTRNAAA